jgi:ATP-binding cassette subfamily F protein uup
VVVSHDRYLVERVCDTTVALVEDREGRPTLAALPGGIEEYLARRRSDAGTPQPSVSAPAAQTSGRLTGAEERAVRKELQRLERQIAKLEQREAKLHDQLATHATDFGKIAELDAELRGVVAEREAAELTWLELGEQL